jgi:hypothetical protein
VELVVVSPLTRTLQVLHTLRMLPHTLRMLPHTLRMLPTGCYLSSRCGASGGRIWRVRVKGEHTLAYEVAYVAYRHIGTDSCAATSPTASLSTRVSHVSLNRH